VADTIEGMWGGEYEAMSKFAHVHRCLV